MAKGSYYLQVLGTGSTELSPTILLFTDTHRYLFNCGESLQRVCGEHKVRLSRVRDIFVTRCTWENLGGLPGFAIYLRHLGVSSIRLRGPPSLASFQRASGVFMRREDVTLEAAVGDGEAAAEPYQDECVTIQPVSLRPHLSHVEARDSSSSESEEEQISWPPRPKKAKFRKPKPDDSTVAYVCKLPSIPGKFNPLKAQQMGLPPGPQYAELVKGKSVTTPEGRVVHPHDVLGPERKGLEFVVIECPHAGYIQSVAMTPSLQASSVQPEIMVHLCPRHVVEDRRYQEWLLTFDPNTKHLLVHPDFCPAEVALRATLKIQLPLHLLDSRFFHLPSLSSSNPPVGEEDKLLPRYPPSSPLHFIIGQSLLKYHLRPASKAGTVELETLQPIADEVNEKLTNVLSDGELCSKLGLEAGPDNNASDGSSGTCSTALRDVAEQSGTSCVTRPFIFPPSLPTEVALTFLGTAAAAPSKYRNVSGILLHTAHGRHMLLDCGEGTLSQLYACFGCQQAEQVLRNLSAVFISHIHGDHHLGLIRIIQRRRELKGRTRREEDLVVIGPSLLAKWLGEYSLFCERTKYSFLNSLLFECTQDQPPLPQQLLHLGLSGLRTVPVKHCAQSYGIVLDSKEEGWRLVYSGDTRPCPQLIEAGKRATVLIHEATFEHDLLPEAISRKHSTTREALEVAQQMDSQFTILTHFSQRYPKVSAALFNEHCFERVAVAFDGMTVGLRDLHHLNSLLPPIQEVFSTVVDQQEMQELVAVQVPTWP